MVPSLPPVSIACSTMRSPRSFSAYRRSCRWRILDHGLLGRRRPGDGVVLRAALLAHRLPPSPDTYCTTRPSAAGRLAPDEDRAGQGLPEGVGSPVLVLHRDDAVQVAHLSNAQQAPRNEPVVPEVVE